MLVKFYYHPERKGERDGLPFYENEIYVEIFRDSTNTVVRRATQDHFDLYPESYAAFTKTSAKMDESGYPIELWPALTPADVENLKAAGLTTVEKLSQSVLGKVPPHLHHFISLAKDQIKVARGSAAEELNQLREENEILKSQLAESKSLVNSLRKAKEAA